MNNRADSKVFRLMVAPLQGFTEAAWRRAHSVMFGAGQGEVEYFTPFLRVEKGCVRARDMRDYTSGRAMGVDATPQIIFKDAAEWSLLVKTLIDVGAERIDMNLGCPFPPQVKRGRGAGMLRRVEELKAVAELMESMEQVQWSAKMRLGVDMADEALVLTDVINQMRLRHVTVHPRTAGQQYSGTLHTDALSELVSALRHPVVFNGDITTPEQIDAVMARGFAGVMVGRGLLSRPSLYAEWRSGTEMPAEERVDAYFTMLAAMLRHFRTSLCGDSQIISKIRPYCEYAPAEADRKIIKQLRKATSLRAYDRILAAYDDRVRN